MVSRLYCDRCKQEMKLGTQSYVKVGDVRFSDIGDGNAEVCETCAKDIIRFVKEKPTKPIYDMFGQADALFGESR